MKNKKAMTTLLSVLAEKEFGTYFEMSHLAKIDEKLVRASMDVLADGLIPAIRKSGYKPIKGKQKVIITNPEMSGPLRQYGTIGGLCKAALDESPTAFVIFAGHQIMESQRKIHTAEEKANYAEKREARAMSIIRESVSIREIRRELKKWDEEVDAEFSGDYDES